MVEITFYDSDEDMWEDLGRAMKAADARVTEEQKKYRAGDIFLSDSGYGFPIFNEILDIEKLVKDNLWRYGDDYEDEGIDTLDLYREPHMKYYRFCRAYSEVVPEGELGDVHLSVGLYRIPKELFEEISARGFRLEGDPE